MSSHQSALSHAMPPGEFISIVVTVSAVTDRTGMAIQVPALLTARGLVAPLVDFCAAWSQGRSMDWLEKTCRACQLFLEFAAVHRDLSDRALLEAFALRLHTGTFDVGKGIDPSWLCWQPVSRANAKRTLSHLTTFFATFETLRERFQFWRSPYDTAIDQAAYAHAREKAFLGHTWSMQPKRRAVTEMIAAPLPRSLSVRDTEPPAFPEDRFAELLLRGWCKGGKYSYRDMLITLLLNGAGVRLSEVFHLYVSDVHISPSTGSAIVLFHHPEEGLAPEDWWGPDGKLQAGDRQSYLKGRWQLRPRNQQRGSNHAGWKGAALTEINGSKAFRAYWFVPQMGEIFAKIWSRYLVDLVAAPRAHPYAFVNISRGSVGTMYKMSTYRQAHDGAVRRIGLEPARVLGTTPHGHRHAYGRRLVKGGVQPQDIQHYMHHCSFESHLVYTQPSQQEVSQAMRSAADRLLDASSRRNWDSLIDEVGYQMRRV